VRNTHCNLIIALTKGKLETIFDVVERTREKTRECRTIDNASGNARIYAEEECVPRNLELAADYSEIGHVLEST
jgi:hypothetical protein